MHQIARIRPRRLAATRCAPEWAPRLCPDHGAGLPAHAWHPVRALADHGPDDMIECEMCSSAAMRAAGAI